MEMEDDELFNEKCDRAVVASGPLGYCVLADWERTPYRPMLFEGLEADEAWELFRRACMGELGHADAQAMRCREVDWFAGCPGDILCDMRRP